MAMRTEQQGGTAVWTRGSMVHRAAEKGGDPLGRWAWTRFRGQNNRWLRVVSGYRPVFNLNDLNSTYNQHLRLLPPSSPEPRKAFLDDLGSQLSSWHTQGDLLVVMLDANEDVRLPTIATVFESLSLINVMYDPSLPLFPQPILPTSSGRFPIDGIFVSRSLAPLLRGYTAQGAQLSTDHSCLWFDLPCSVLFGSALPPHVPASSPTRLTCQDPRVVAAYNSLFASYLLEHKLPQRALALHLAMHSLPLDELLRQYDLLDSLRLRGMQFAEKRCRKLRMGKYAYTPGFPMLVPSSLRGVLFGRSSVVGAWIASICVECYVMLNGLLLLSTISRQLRWRICDGRKAMLCSGRKKLMLLNVDDCGRRSWLWHARLMTINPPLCI